MSIADLQAEAGLARELGREVPTVYGIDQGTDDKCTAVYMELMPNGALAIVDITEITPAHQKMLRYGLERMRCEAQNALLVSPRLPGRKTIAGLVASIVAAPMVTALPDVAGQPANSPKERMQQLRANVLGKKGRF